MHVNKFLELPVSLLLSYDLIIKCTYICKAVKPFACFMYCASSFKALLFGIALQYKFNNIVRKGNTMVQNNKFP